MSKTIAEKQKKRPGRAEDAAMAAVYGRMGGWWRSCFSRWIGEEWRQSCSGSDLYSLAQETSYLRHNVSQDIKPCEFHGNCHVTSTLGQLDELWS